MKKFWLIIVLVLIVGGIAFGYMYQKSLPEKTKQEALLVELDPIEDNQIEAQAPELPEPEIVNYNGPATFSTYTESWPCEDYAFDSDICDKDPNGTVETDYFRISLDTKFVSKKLEKFLKEINKDSNGSVAGIKDKKYWIHLTCDYEGGGLPAIAVDSPYYERSYKIRNYSTQNLTKKINFDIDINQGPEDGTCANVSIISEIHSIE